MHAIALLLAVIAVDNHELVDRGAILLTCSAAGQASLRADGHRVGTYESVAPGLAMIRLPRQAPAKSDLVDAKGKTLGSYTRVQVKSPWSAPVADVNASEYTIEITAHDPLPDDARVVVISDTKGHGLAWTYVRSGAQRFSISDEQTCEGSAPIFPREQSTVRLTWFDAHGREAKGPLVRVGALYTFEDEIMSDRVSPEEIQLEPRRD